MENLNATKTEEHYSIVDNGIPIHLTMQYNTKRFYVQDSKSVVLFDGDFDKIDNSIQQAETLLKGLKFIKSAIAINCTAEFPEEKKEYVLYGNEVCEVVYKHTNGDIYFLHCAKKSSLQFCNSKGEVL